MGLSLGLVNGKLKFEQHKASSDIRSTYSKTFRASSDRLGRQTSN